MVLQVKKRNKILLFTLLSLIGVVVLAIGTVCTIIFSPKILVPIVEKNLNKVDERDRNILERLAKVEESVFNVTKRVDEIYKLEGT